MCERGASGGGALAGFPVAERAEARLVWLAVELDLAMVDAEGEWMVKLYWMCLKKGKVSGVLVLVGVEQCTRLCTLCLAPVQGACSP